MNRFLREVIGFAIMAYALLWVIDLSYSSFVARSGQFGVSQWNEIVHGKIDADVVAMGNSRALHHINPIVLDSLLGTNSYNLALDGAPINYQIRKYRVYCHHNKEPKLIIQNIDYVSLHYGSGMEKKDLFPFWWDPAIRREIMPYEPYPISEKVIPFYRYHGQNLSSLVRHEEHRLAKGFDPVDSDWDGTAFQQIDSITFIPDERTIQMLESFLSEAQLKNVKVVFVYTPIYKGVIEKMTNLGEMYSVYQRISDSYGVPILDYTDIDLCQDTTLFFNALHLNKRGAEVFSDSLAYDIKRLNLI